MSENEPRDQDDQADYATLCTDPECGAMFFNGEIGFDYEQCFDCGANTQEVPA